MKDEFSIPPLRDLPPGRLAQRREHLTFVIARERDARGALARLWPKQWPRPGRRRILVLAAASLLLLATASAAGFSTVRDLFSDDRRTPVAATWSSEGRRIAFVTVCTRGCGGRVDVNVMDVNGGGQRRLLGRVGIRDP